MPQSLSCPPCCSLSGPGESKTRFAGRARCLGDRPGPRPWSPASAGRLSRPGVCGDRVGVWGQLSHGAGLDTLGAQPPDALLPAHSGRRDLK